MFLSSDVFFWPFEGLLHQVQSTSLMDLLTTGGTRNSEEFEREG